MEAIGRTHRATAEHYIPVESSSADLVMASHETACALIMKARDVHVAITMFFADREPAGAYRVTVGSRRTLPLRVNDLKHLEPVPRDTKYAPRNMRRYSSPMCRSSCNTRLDPRRAEIALLSTVAYGEA